MDRLPGGIVYGLGSLVTTSPGEKSTNTPHIASVSPRPSRASSLYYNLERRRGQTAKGQDRAHSTVDAPISEAFHSRSYTPTIPHTSYLKPGYTFGPKNQALSKETKAQPDEEAHDLL